MSHTVPPGSIWSFSVVTAVMYRTWIYHHILPDTEQFVSKMSAERDSEPEGEGIKELHPTVVIITGR